MADIPDIKAAFINRLLSFSDLTNVYGTKIGSVHRKAWGAQPGYMLVIRLAGQGPGAANWYEVGFQSTRLDFLFYGSTPDNANDFWRAAHPYICPQQGATQRHAFKQANCRVIAVEQESGPIEVIDDVSSLPFTAVSYVAVWAEVPS